MKNYIYLFFLLALVTGCAKLAPSGPYNGDAFLYNSDLSIVTSKDVLETFVTWEKANRPALAKYPEIRKFADDLRKNAPGWYKSAITIRDTYSTTKSQESKSALTTVLATLEAATTQAATYMVSAAKNKPE